MKKFEDYYEKYLGIENHISNEKFILSTPMIRDIPINKKYYHSIIITVYKGSLVVSLSVNKKEFFQDKIVDFLKDKSLDELYMQLKNSTHDITVRKMFRMTIDHQNDCNLSKDYEYIYLHDYRKYLVKVNCDTVSYCKVSDIFCGFGNVVVWTDERYRNKGLAKSCLSQIIDKRVDTGVDLIYHVDVNNIASLNLAKKLGFTIKSTEIIISEECIQ